MSDFAKTPQREAMGYTFSARSERASISGTEIFKRVAIWVDEGRPCRPAQLPFIGAARVPPVTKMILASSPPSSTAASASG